MPYTWDAARQQFRDSRGRFVPATRPQLEFSKSLAKVGARVTTMDAELKTGKLSLAAWRVEMQTIIKQVNVAGAALARGGFDKLTEDDFARLEEKITGEYLYLEAWVSDMQDGTAPLGGDPGRAKLYVAQGRVTYHDERHESVRGEGYNEVRSILHPAEHCDDCIEQAGLGWQDVADFVPIGARQCRANDRCTVEYRRVVNA